MMVTLGSEAPDPMFACDRCHRQDVRLDDLVQLGAGEGDDPARQVCVKCYHQLLANFGLRAADIAELEQQGD